MGFGMATSVMTGPVSRRFRARRTVGFQLRRQYYRTTSRGTIGLRPLVAPARRARPWRATYGGRFQSMQSFASMLHQDRLLPTDPGVRRIARALYEGTKSLPIVSPHGHCDPAALADDAPFDSPATELVTKDHYILRMLYSQGGRSKRWGCDRSTERRRSRTEGRFGVSWRRASRSSGAPRRSSGSITHSKRSSASKNRSTRRTPTRCTTRSRCVCRRRLRPRALFDRFGIEFLATTDGALDPLAVTRAAPTSPVGRVASCRPSAPTT